MVKLTTSSCASYSLSVTFDTQTGTIVCSGGTGVLYLKQTTAENTLTVTSSEFQDAQATVPAPTQFETLVSLTMGLTPVTLTIKDAFNGNLNSVSGLAVTVDDVAQTLDANSQITFTPAREQYILKVVYQTLELYSATPANTNVQVKSVTKVVASNCGTVLLSATLDGQTKSVTCVGGAGTMYFAAPTSQKELQITSAKHKTFTANVLAPTQFETTISAAMRLNDVTLTLQGFGASLVAFTGLVAKIDGVAQTLTAQSQITFEPATDAYVLTVEYQNLQLYN